MNPVKVVGRRIGILLVVQFASALIVPFVLIDKLTKGYPAYLESAAGSSASIRTGVAIAVFGAGMTLLLGVWMLPVLERHRRGAAAWFLAVCIVSAVLDLVQNASVLSMLAVTEQNAIAGGADAAVYHAWAAVAASLRRSTHIMQLVAVAGWMLSFYIMLFRFKLAPRALAALGVVGVLGQFTGVTFMMFQGYSPLTMLAVPLAPIHIATAAWLIRKGFPGDSE